MPTAKARFLLVVVLFAGCGGAGKGDPIRVDVPQGASFATVSDSLAARDIISSKALFKVYGRLKGAAGSIKPGTYAFKRGIAWSTILGDLKAGRVLTARLTIPEAYDMYAVAPRIAEVTGLKPDSVLSLLSNESYARKFDAPGPTLEGYLYPATYSFPLQSPVDSVIAKLVATYRRVWTPARKARADSLKLNEREVITLASIVEREARKVEEMPTISAVYHNRLRIGMALQADPTVQYALGKHRDRLLYAAIDSVADNPYNTYRNRGLPPGPIGSPSERAIDAALRPAAADYLYFVANLDGSHVFTRNLADHNRAKQSIQRARAAAAPATPAPPAKRP